MDEDHRRALARVEVRQPEPVDLAVAWTRTESPAGPRAPARRCAPSSPASSPVDGRPAYPRVHRLGSRRCTHSRPATRARARRREEQIPFYIVGGLLVSVGATVSLGLGRAPTELPRQLAGQRAVMAITIVLVIGGTLGRRDLTSGSLRGEPVNRRARAPQRRRARNPARVRPPRPRRRATPGPPRRRPRPASRRRPPPGRWRDAQLDQLAANPCRAQLAYNTKLLSAKAGYGDDRDDQHVAARTQRHDRRRLEGARSRPRPSKAAPSRSRSTSSRAPTRSTAPSPATARPAWKARWASHEALRLLGDLPHAPPGRTPLCQRVPRPA